MTKRIKPCPHCGTGYWSDENLCHYCNTTREGVHYMTIRWNMYKTSGKWYGGGIIDIPYDTNIFDEDVVNVIMNTQAELNKDLNSWKDCFLTVETVDDIDKFFTNLFKL